MNQVDLIRERLEPINLMIPTTLPLARGRALAAMRDLGIDRDAYPTTYAHCFSSGLRQMIVEDGIEGWQVIGASDRLHLLDESGLRIRFLKELSFGGLPPAGHNRSRIETWSQGTLDLDGTAAEESDHPLEDIELIVVWSEEQGRFACTAYQPLEPGSWPGGAAGRAIMRMPLGIAPDAFASLSFDGRTREEPLIPRANTIVSEPEGARP